MNDENKKLDVDVGTISSELSLTPEIYMRILTKSIPQTTQDVSDLEAAFQGGDCDTIQRISHRLKGTFDNLRIVPMASTARKLNDNAKAAGSMEDMRQLFEEFKCYFAQLIQQISIMSSE